MPCSDGGYGDYLQREAEALEAAAISTALLFGVGVTELKNDWGSFSETHLCCALRKLEAENTTEFEAKIYNGRDPNARKVADWWDTHREKDEKERERFVRELQRYKNSGKLSFPIKILFVCKKTDEAAVTTKKELLLRQQAHYTDCLPNDLRSAFDEVFGVEGWELVICNKVNRDTLVLRFTDSKTQEIGLLSVKMTELSPEQSRIYDIAYEQIIRVSKTP
jgi:hypothetical protein